MNAFRRPFRVELPDLSFDQVEKLFEKTQDLVILLDSEQHVVGYFQDNLFDETDLSSWIGQKFSDLIYVDSMSKLKPLLENDASKENAGFRWRHINLKGLNSNVLPVLAKSMRLPADEFSQAVFCRDLRPIEQTNKKFIEAQQQLTTENLALRNQLSEKDRDLIHQELVNSKKLQFLINQTSYQQVIEETVANLERQCLQSFLKDANGNQALAAKKAGLSLDELNEKLQFFRLH
ncbi:MAG: hypothetical protein RLZZ189_662 [Pseudomonadota bacterium]